MNAPSRNCRGLLITSCSRPTSTRSLQSISSCNRPLHVPSTAVVDSTSEALSGAEITLDNEERTNPHLEAGAQRGQTGYGLLEWPALLRRLDRLDPSYAQ